MPAVSTGASLLNVVAIDTQKTRSYSRLNRRLLKGSSAVIALPLAIMGLYQLVQDIDLSAFNFDFLKDLGNFDFLNKDYPSSPSSHSSSSPIVSTSPTTSAVATEGLAKPSDTSSSSLSTQSSTTPTTTAQRLVNRGYNLPKASDTVVSALKGAESKNVGFRTLYAVAGAESSFREKVSASTSSAQGLFQFTLPTWKYLTGTVFPKLGYEDKDRLDSNKSAKLASLYLGMIQSSLLKGLGRLPSLGETYIGYFLGPTGALKLVKAAEQDPTKLAADLFPSAAKANPNVFYDKGNLSKPYTLSEVVGVQTQKVEKFAANVSSESQETAPTLVASASTSPVIQQVNASSLLPSTQAKSSDISPYVPVYVDFKPATEVAVAKDTNSKKPMSPNSSVLAANKHYVKDSSNKLYSIST